ncbi:hypothetical protein SynA1825c_00098 [Synechococcus sp. A18-25c]|uniref:hypothetical protein n=1 Tax=Synechococcus sp. A18-25c TaxID=1866938 RepID=UPI001644CBB8|nr:hypothetical protein [Synechococcus sp. A18-25c]QNJ18441.1 hypothetical protein SynA1825c_00098 [Synechococcus sp. A18-25c]
MTSTTALVLAGGSLAGKTLGPSPLLSRSPAELPDGSGFALDHIRERLNNAPSITSLMVVVDADQPHARPMRGRQQWQCLTIPAQPSVLASLEAALAVISTEQVLVQPITTLPPTSLPEGCWIGLGDQALPRENWSAVSALDADAPQFHPKQQPRTDHEPDSHPFTGLISAPTARLRQLLAERQQQPGWTPSSDLDLLSVAEGLWMQGDTRLERVPWLDLGHRATASRRRLSRLTSRGFNSVSYCASDDLIRKRSKDATRLAQEAAYFEALPQPLQRYFPACLSHEPGQLELEYIPFPSLAELFLHWQIGPNSWRQLMQRLSRVRTGLGEAPAITPPPPVTVDWLYSRKLQQRLEQLQRQPPLLADGSHWTDWWTRGWTLKLCARHGDATHTLTLPSPAAAATSLLEHLPSLEASRPLQRIHGDLCFNNILAEPQSGSIRLIDPRGERPDGAPWPIGFGDPRYDQIKLLHSGRYLYDVVVNDLFSLEKLSPGHLRLHLDVPAHYDALQQAMDSSGLLQGLLPEEERWLTSSLFVSMLPLHREDGDRCLAFIAIGMMILEAKFDAVLR